MSEPDAVASPEQLLAAAKDQLHNAYAPYSGFPVAAAVMDGHGRVFTGVNVENASYGLTICAERAAIFSAIAAGARKIIAVAVTAQHRHPVVPCGACRQVMAEFGKPELPIHSDSPMGIVTWTLNGLLPEAFVNEPPKAAK